MIHHDMDLGLGTLKTHIKTSGIILTIVVLVTLGFAVAMGLVLRRLVGEAFYKCLNLSNRISKGDLTDTIDLNTLPEDETGNIQMVVSAAEEMASTTQEISKNISQAASGVQEVNDSMNQMSAVKEEVTQEISEVNTAANESLGNSNQVKESAQGLTFLAEQLNQMIDGFKL